MRIDELTACIGSLISQQPAVHRSHVSTDFGEGEAPAEPRFQLGGSLAQPFLKLVLWFRFISRQQFRQSQHRFGVGNEQQRPVYRRLVDFKPRPRHNHLITGNRLPH